MKYGMGYVEYLALKEEIQEYRAAGYKMSVIYRELVSKKKLTMSYFSFVRYVSGRFRNKKAPLPDISTFRTKKEKSANVRKSNVQLTSDKEQKNADNMPVPVNQNVPAQASASPIISESLSTEDKIKLLHEKTPHKVI